MNSIRNKYIVILVVSCVFFFGICANLVTIIVYGNITLNNTTEFTATVKNVLVRGSGDNESIIIVTEEYGDKLNVFQPYDFADREDYLSIEEGEKITFRIEDAWLESFEEQPFINIVQLRTETREIFSLVNYATYTESEFNYSVAGAKLICIAFLGVVIFCIYKLYTTSSFYKKKTQPDWCKF